MLFEKQITNIYRRMAYTRCDENKTAFYFSADDFLGLNKESFVFKSSKNHDLQGYFYYYDNPISNRLIIFEHGFGGGHRSYMKEIEKLCKYGFKVFAYDHTGCMESGGENPNGMSQSLCDLNDCINALKNKLGYKAENISVIGHSWGGFSTLNILSLHPQISHIVVISGFVSVKMLIDSYFRGLLKFYRSSIMRIEENANPDFVNFNAIETLSKTDAKVLLIYSDNDKMCHKSVHYDALKENLSNRENIEFILTEEKGHNPNYTLDAVKYLGEYFRTKAKMTRKKLLTTDEDKEKFVASFDWNRMTEQDEEVWKKIFNHFEKV